MTWFSPRTDFGSVISLLPQTGELFEQFYKSFGQQSHIDSSSLELCRLRLAQLHNSELAWNQEDCPVEESKKDALSHWNTSGLFSDAERACLEYTEIYAMDVSSITDQLADVVKAHYGEAGLVALVEALGVFDGITRMGLLWQLSENK